MVRAVNHRTLDRQTPFLVHFRHSPVKLLDSPNSSGAPRPYPITCSHDGEENGDGKQSAKPTVEPGCNHGGGAGIRRNGSAAEYTVAGHPVRGMARRCCPIAWPLHKLARV